MIGLREVLLIGMMVLVLYGRSGVLKGQRAQRVLPWLSPVRRGGGHPSHASGARAAAGSAGAQSRISGGFLTRGNRLYWCLTIIAATAVAAWIITRTLITSGTGPALTPP